MITAVVPARGGSKRLPGKNIKSLNGRPLIFHTIDSLIGHELINCVVFTSDSEDYIELVKAEYGEKVNLELRPASYAQDKTKVYDELVRLKSEKVLRQDWFMLCLPTAPLRTHDTVRRLLAEWWDDQTPRFAACRYDFPIQFGFSINEDGDWEPSFTDSPMETGNTRSQDIPIRYRPTGSIYLQRLESLGVAKTFYIDAKPFITDGNESIDVDTELDFEIAEIIMKRLLRNSRGS